MLWFIKTNKKDFVQQGFSLIEVLVFLSILGFVFISGIALGTVSVRNSINAENKILAARYGEELLSWLRSEKDADWLVFVNKTSIAPGISYCFDQEPVRNWPSSGNCGRTQLVKGLFKRQVVLIYDNNSQYVSVNILIEWNEGSNSYNLPIKGVFSQLE